MVSLAATVNCRSLRRTPGGLNLNLILSLFLVSRIATAPGTILQIHYFSRTVRLHNRLHDTDVPEPLLARD